MCRELLMFTSRLTRWLFTTISVLTTGHAGARPTQGKTGVLFATNSPPFQAGDQIVAVDGEEVATIDFDVIADMLAVPGTTVRVKNRLGQIREVTIE